MSKIKGKNLKSYLKQKMKDPEFKIEYEEVKMHLKIAEMIRKLRLKSNLTQTELAHMAEVSQPMSARLERGDQDRLPTLTTINKILYALGYKANLTIKKAA